MTVKYYFKAPKFCLFFLTKLALKDQNNAVR